MSFSKKVLVLSFLLLVSAPIFFVWYYKKTHPAYIPLPPRQEIEITIIPGWNLRQVAEYFVAKYIATSTDAVFAITGEPARLYRNCPSIDLPDGSKTPVCYGSFFYLYDDIEMRPANVSLEGYLAPDTYRIFADATVHEVLEKLIRERDSQVDKIEVEKVILDTGRSWHQILTMASIIEKEVKYEEDRALVSDILWRRLAKGWALQVDSSVHYVVDRTGDVFTTEQERDADSPWNTYKYPGLPPGPISNPGLASVKAALYPQKNNYWYFLSDRDGRMYYGRTLEEHSRNKFKYLK